VSTKITKTIIKIAKDNNGIITSSMLTKKGISRGNLKYLCDTDKLIHSSRGIYMLEEAVEDDFFAVQNRFKKGIFSCETALFLLNLTDRTPNYFSMTFPEHYNLTSPKKAGIKCKVEKNDLYSIGITKVKTIYGNYVYCYNKEYTLCDILRRKNTIDIQIITTAFKTYINNKDKNIHILSKYSKQMKVENKVRNYLEVLL